MKKGWIIATIVAIVVAVAAAYVLLSGCQKNGTICEEFTMED